MFFIQTLKKFLKGRRKNLIFVAIGDSTVEGIGATKPNNAFCGLIFQAMQVRYAHATYYNFGKAGAKVKEVLIRQAHKVIALKPDIIIVSIGANDIIQGTRTKRFNQRFYKLLLRLRKETNATIVVNNIPDMTVTSRIPGIFHPLLQRRVRQYNAIIQKQTTAAKGLLIDLYAHSTILRGITSFISPDGLHPSDTGYAVWASIVLTKLLPLLT